MRTGRIAAAAVVPVLLTLTVLAPVGPLGGASATMATKLAQFDAKVSHIVFLVQENHAFDNLYGTYCTALGKYCPFTANGIPAGSCVPKDPRNASLGCIVPYDLSGPNVSAPADMLHNWNSTHTAWDHGAMDGFYRAEYRQVDTFGHYNASTATVYWDLAEQYGLADDFFSSVASYSLPNHWYVLGSSAPNASYVVRLAANSTSWGAQTRYLNESNATRSIEDELVNSSVSWKYYDYGLAPYHQAIQHRPVGPAYDYWSPLEARAASYLPATASHFQGRSAYFGDAANGTLPNVSWIIPAAQNSDHPSYNISAGQDWVASVVDALERSPEWNSTVLFLTWDEYGGYYDHVAPPAPDSYGDGFRVPLLAIGPWVRQGYIDHAAMSFGSVLHLMESRFGLACLGPRDCKATLPLGMFTFAKGPRAPIQIFPYGTAVYPMPLQSSHKLPYYGPMAAPPPSYVDPGPVPAAVAGDPAIDWN